MAELTETDALRAVDTIIDNFGSNQRGAYFSGFAPEATFVFHSSPVRVESRADYESTWDDWVRDSGFEVVRCSSSARRIQLFGDVAVFTHDVETILRLDGVPETQRERETIVLEFRDGHWLAVHEHLSART